MTFERNSKLKKLVCNEIYHFLWNLKGKDEKLEINIGEVYINKFTGNLQVFLSV